MGALSVHVRHIDNLGDGLHRFWTAIAERLADPRIPTWDTLVAFLHDDGTVFAYPARCILPFRYPATPDETSFDTVHFEEHRESGVSLQIDAFAAELDSLDGACLEDRAREHAFAAVIARRVELLRESAQRTNALGALVDAPRRGVQWVLEAESLHEVVVRPLLGPALPPPRTPTTCLEVFARLLVAAQSAVYRTHSGLTWSRDQLVAVELAGADVNDEVLDLLGEVPQVADLCTGLERLDLRAARVSDAAVERARARLPHVAVRSTR